MVDCNLIWTENELMLAINDEFAAHVQPVAALKNKKYPDLGRSVFAHLCILQRLFILLKVSVARN